MPQYVAIGSHEPSQCPGANAKMREVWKKLLDGAPAIGQKHGVKRIGAPLHLDPSHKILVVFEGPSQDAVQDHIAESRLGQIQSMELYRGSDLLEMFKAAGDMPALY